VPGLRGALGKCLWQLPAHRIPICRRARAGEVEARAAAERRAHKLTLGLAGAALLLVVGDAWQRLGRHLMGRLVEVARERGGAG
jgi:hypothetical protein